jgi:hypothetical protein
VRSMVGPAAALRRHRAFERALLEKYPSIATRVRRFLDARPSSPRSSTIPASGVSGRRSRRCSTRTSCAACCQMLDESEFLIRYGHPVHLALPRPASLRVQRRHPGVPGVVPPAESDSGMFGGNSNWRGPIWMPVNGLISGAAADTTPTTATASRSSVPPDRAPG